MSSTVSTVESGDPDDSCGGKRFTIPKRKAESKKLLTKIAIEDREFQKDILHDVLTKSAWNKESVGSFRYTECQLINNPALLKNFEEKRKELKAANYAEKEQQITYGFLQSYSSAEVETISREGLYCNHSTLGTLGKPEMGVYLSRYADVFSPAPLIPGVSSGLLIIFKVLKGKVKAVQTNSPSLEPTPNFDCHVSKDVHSQLVKGSPYQLFQALLMYLYEYVNGEIVECPRNVLPVAVVTYSFIEATPDPRTSRVQPQKPTVQQPPRFRTLWQGQLCSASGSLRISEVHMLANFTTLKPSGLGSSITIKKLVPFEAALAWGPMKELININNSGLLCKKRELRLGADYAAYYKLEAPTNARSTAQLVEFAGQLLEKRVVAIAGLRGGTVILVLPASEFSAAIGIPVSTDDTKTLHCVFISYRSVTSVTMNSNPVYDVVPQQTVPPRSVVKVAQIFNLFRENQADSNKKSPPVVEGSSQGATPSNAAEPGPSNIPSESKGRAKKAAGTTTEVAAANNNTGIDGEELLRQLDGSALQQLKDPRVLQRLQQLRLSQPQEEQQPAASPSKPSAMSSAEPVAQIDTPSSPTEQNAAPAAPLKEHVVTSDEDITDPYEPPDEDSEAYDPEQFEADAPIDVAMADSQLSPVRGSPEVKEAVDSISTDYSYLDAHSIISLTDDRLMKLRRAQEAMAPRNEFDSDLSFVTPSDTPSSPPRDYSGDIDSRTLHPVLVPLEDRRPQSALSDTKDTDLRRPASPDHSFTSDVDLRKSRLPSTASDALGKVVKQELGSSHDREANERRRSAASPPSHDMAKRPRLEEPTASSAAVDSKSAELCAFGPVLLPPEFGSRDVDLRRLPPSTSTVRPLFASQLSSGSGGLTAEQPRKERLGQNYFREFPSRSTWQPPIIPMDQQLPGTSSGVQRIAPLLPELTGRSAHHYADTSQDHRRYDVRVPDQEAVVSSTTPDASSAAPQVGTTVHFGYHLASARPPGGHLEPSVPSAAFFGADAEAQRHAQYVAENMRKVSRWLSDYDAFIQASLGEDDESREAQSYAPSSDESFADAFDDVPNSAQDLYRSQLYKAQATPPRAAPPRSDTPRRPNWFPSLAIRSVSFKAQERQMNAAKEVPNAAEAVASVPKEVVEERTASSESGSPYDPETGFTPLEFAKAVKQDEVRRASQLRKPTDDASTPDSHSTLPYITEAVHWKAAAAVPLPNVSSHPSAFLHRERSATPEVAFHTGMVHGDQPPPFEERPEDVAEAILGPVMLPPGTRAAHEDATVLIPGLGGDEVVAVASAVSQKIPEQVSPSKKDSAVTDAALLEKKTKRKRLIPVDVTGESMDQIIWEEAIGGASDDEDQEDSTLRETLLCLEDVANKQREPEEIEATSTGLDTPLRLEGATPTPSEDSLVGFGNEESVAIPLEEAPLVVEPESKPVASEQPTSQRSSELAFDVGHIDPPVVECIERDIVKSSASERDVDVDLLKSSEFHVTEGEPDLDEALFFDAESQASIDDNSSLHGVKSFDAAAAADLLLLSGDELDSVILQAQTVSSLDEAKALPYTSPVAENGELPVASSSNAEVENGDRNENRARSVQEEEDREPHSGHSNDSAEEQGGADVEYVWEACITQTAECELVPACVADRAVFLLSHEHLSEESLEDAITDDRLSSDGELSLSESDVALVDELSAAANDVTAVVADKTEQQEAAEKQFALDELKRALVDEMNSAMAQTMTRCVDLIQMELLGGKRPSPTALFELNRLSGFSASAKTAMSALKKRSCESNLSRCLVLEEQKFRRNVQEALRQLTPAVQPQPPSQLEFKLEEAINEFMSDELRVLHGQHCALQAYVPAKPPKKFRKILKASLKSFKQDCDAIVPLKIRKSGTSVKPSPVLGHKSLPAKPLDSVSNSPDMDVTVTLPLLWSFLTPLSYNCSLPANGTDSLDFAEFHKIAAELLSDFVCERGSFELEYDSVGSPRLKRARLAPDAKERRPYKFHWLSYIASSVQWNQKYLTPHLRQAFGGVSPMRRTVGVVIPDDHVLTKANPDDLEKILEAFLLWQQKGEGNWRMKLHSQVVLQLAERSKNLEANSDPQKRVTTLLVLLTKYRKLGVIELLAKHSCDASPRSTIEYLSCIAEQKSALQELHPDAICVALSNLNPESENAKEFKRLDIRVMTILEFNEVMVKQCRS